MDSFVYALNSYYNSKYSCDVEAAPSCLGLDCAGLQGRVVNLIDIPSQVAKFGVNVGKHLWSALVVTASLIVEIIACAVGIALWPLDCLCCSCQIPNPCLLSCKIFENGIGIGSQLAGTGFLLVGEIIKAVYCIACDVLGLVCPDFGRLMRLAILEARQPPQPAQPQAAHDGGVVVEETGEDDEIGDPVAYQGAAVIARGLQYVNDEMLRRSVGALSARVRPVVQIVTGIPADAEDPTGVPVAERAPGSVGAVVR